MSAVSASTVVIGAGGDALRFEDQSMFHEQSGVAEQYYEIDPDAFVYDRNSAPSRSAQERWLWSGAAGDYEARIVIVSGSLEGSISDPSNTWLTLGSLRTWGVRVASGPPGNENSCSFLLEVRKVGDTTVLDTAAITITARRPF